MYLSLLQSAENVPPYAVEHLVAVFVASVLHFAENVPSFVVQHAVLGLVVSALDSTGNVSFCAAAHSLLGLVAHEFSFAECDDDEKRQIFVLLGSLYVQPAFVYFSLND